MLIDTPPPPSLNSNASKHMEKKEQMLALNMGKFPAEVLSVVQRCLRNDLINKLLTVNSRRSYLTPAKRKHLIFREVSLLSFSVCLKKGGWREHGIVT